MTTIVSISRFRQNIAGYLEQVKKGATVILSDEKKNEQIAQLVKKKNFNPTSFEIALRTASGIFTDQNHPEWKTEKNISNWLENEREKADRNF